MGLGSKSWYGGQRYHGLQLDEWLNFKKIGTAFLTDPDDGGAVMSIALDGLIFLTGWLHVLISPYSKVEESFNLHATHDVLMYGTGNGDLHQYDHFSFPGAVPRTFIGSLLLAWASAPIIRLAAWSGYATNKFDLQIIARLVLASLNALGLCLIRRAVSRRFGRVTGLFFTLLTCSQFHLPFWMGRTIPNMFALFPVNLSTYLLVDVAPNTQKPSTRRTSLAIALLTFTAVVFRAEVVLLLAPLALQFLVTRKVTFKRLLTTGIISGVASLGATVLIDSYFWKQPFLWPEFVGIYFNVVQGKSEEWGVSPPLTYLINFLPKLLLSAAPLSVLGFIIDARIRSIVVPSLVFIALISLLGHKEWRFVIYTVPIFNIAASRTCRWMVSKRKGTWPGRLLFLVASGLVFVNLLFTIVSTLASRANYPGGEALQLIHHLHIAEGAPRPHVHISNLAAQTGASLFLHLNTPPYLQDILTSPANGNWIYNKTENLAIEQLTAPLPESPFTHLIVEVKPTADVLMHWRVVGVVQVFERLELNIQSLNGKGGDELGIGGSFNGVQNVLQIVCMDSLWVLERLPSTRKR